MNDYKLRVGLSELDRGRNQRTVHIYRVGSPLLFFVNLKPMDVGLVSSTFNKFTYHVCIDKELYNMYMASPQGVPYLNISLHALCTPEEEIQIVLDMISRLNVYMDSTAKHFITILDKLANNAIFETSEN
jgi:hypothetical protein